MEPSTTTKYYVRVSTGAEINEPGKFSLYLTADYGDYVDGAVTVLTDDADSPEALDLGNALDAANRYLRRELEWEPFRHNDEDEFGGYTVAQAVA